jgi:hypothetical protein
VSVFSAELVHRENNIIEATTDGPFSLDESLGIDVRGEVVIGDLAELLGVFITSVGDTAVNGLIAVLEFVGVLGLSVRYGQELVGCDVLVEVAERFLDEGIPVTAAFLDVMELVMAAGGWVGIPHDLVLDIHDVLGWVGNGDEIDIALSKVLDLLGLGFPGLGLGELMELKGVERDRVLFDWLDTVEDSDEGLTILNFGFIHGDADNLVALELHRVDPIECRLAVRGDWAVLEGFVCNVGVCDLCHFFSWFWLFKLMFNIVVLSMSRRRSTNGFYLVFVNIIWSHSDWLIKF